VEGEALPTQLVAQELGIRLENVTMDQLGRAARVVVEKMRAGAGNFGFDAACGRTWISSRRASSTRPRSSAWRSRRPSATGPAALLGQG
jgi:hypothetical protein